MWGVGIVAALVFLATACSDSKSNTSSTGGASAAPQTLSISGSITGSGSSFQDKFDQAVIAKFKDRAPNLSVTYTKKSSGQGIGDLATKSVAFAGTDRAVKDAEKATLTGGDILYFPTVAAPITVSYNVPGVDKNKPLQLDGATLAKIFSGTITSWSANEISATNPGVSLTGDIVVCHRDADSGTTANFTSFLDKVDHADMKLQVGGNPNNWPASSIAGAGNSGVASCITGGNGRIGYVDVADAITANLTFASVKNAAGKFVQPTLDATNAALTASASTLKADLTYDPINATGDGSYPITSPTWIIVYKNQPSKAQGDAVKAFLNFTLTDGQAEAAGAAFAGLPSDLRQKAVAQLDQLVIPTS